jgi:hypothetical protein
LYSVLDFEIFFGIDFRVFFFFFWVHFSLNLLNLEIFFVLIFGFFLFFSFSFNRLTFLSFFWFIFLLNLLDLENFIGIDFMERGEKKEKKKLSDVVGKWERKKKNWYSGVWAKLGRK